MPIETPIQPDNGVTPQVSQLAAAAALQTSLASSKLALFQEGMIALSPTTTLAELQAAEATYDGYTTGGVTITAFGAPYLDPSGLSVLITAPSHQFQYSDGTGHVHNSIAGAYLVDSTGVLRGAVQWSPAVDMSANDDAVVVAYSIRVE